MAKLTVKNVGPIREAEIEVKKHTVFIGPQGTGKSTLAKLIAIGEDTEISEPSGSGLKSLIIKYNLSTFLNKSTHWKFDNRFYNLVHDQVFQLELTSIAENIIDDYKSQFMKQSTDAKQILPLNDFRDSIEWLNDRPSYEGNAMAQSHNFYYQILPIAVGPKSVFIPTERHLFPLLSDAIWGLIYSNINLPKALTFFGQLLEFARNAHDLVNIPFLKIQYQRKKGKDYVEYKDGQSISLAQSASGYQSIIPLLLVVEDQRRQWEHRFIIEEPELNLYPTAQKDLIYSLMSGLDPNVDYKDAEWVFTTHSPYVLTSFNTLMLAYKVAQKSDELRAEVEKIIPARCWIDPNEFAAYYVDNGTVRSIISEKTGMIADSELDNVSEDFAGEQDQLLDLYRSVPSA